MNLETLLTMDLFGYEIAGNLEAAVITLIVVVEALVLYVVYEGLNRAVSSALGIEMDDEGPHGGDIH